MTFVEIGSVPIRREASASEWAPVPDGRVGPTAIVFLAGTAFGLLAPIIAREGSGAGAAVEQATLFQPPVVSTEGLDGQKNRWATSSDPAAKKIHVEGPSSKGGDVAASPTPSPAPTREPRHRLSREEIRERLLLLEPKYKEWLDIAGPLLTEEELSGFLQSTAPEKDRFIRDFWKHHS